MQHCTKTKVTGKNLTVVCNAHGTKNLVMKLYQFLASDINSVFLYLFILFADLDYTSITEYAIKAFIGGALWFGFKLLGDFFSRRIKAWYNKKTGNQDEA